MQDNTSEGVSCSAGSRVRRGMVMSSRGLSVCKMFLFAVFGLYIVWWFGSEGCGGGYVLFGCVV